MSFAIRRFALAFTAVAALALSCLAGSALAAEPGVNSDATWGISSSEVDRSISLMDQAGVKWARVAVSWQSVEPNSKGSYNTGYMSNIDSIIDRMHAAGIEVELEFDTVPYWASADPNKYVDSGGTKHWNSHYRPTSFQDYADAYGYVARRLSAHGVSVFEVWNEPNLSVFWPSGPDASEYARMLKAAYPAIKAAAPGSTVIGGTLSQNDYRFLAGIYAAGAGSSFDAVSTHEYPSSGPQDCWNDSSGKLSREAFCSIEEVRQTMVANGDSAKDIWLDEFGWSTCDNSYGGCYGKGVSESRQADFTQAAFRKLENYPYVKAALVYNFRATYWKNESRSSWEANLGLLHVDYSPKPAYQALADYALGGGGSGGTASEPPSVHLTAPSAGSEFYKSLEIAADATDDNAVTKVELWVDDRLVSTDSAAPYEYEWRVPKKLSYDTHVVKARAFDADGQVATDTVSVTRTRNVTLAVSSSTAKLGDSTIYRARGRVSGARRGHVAIKLQRRSSGKWVTVSKKRARLRHHGRYRSRLGTLKASHKWRARALYRPARHRPVSRSRYRYFGVS